MATVPWIYNKPPFSPLTDFEMVGMVAESPMALMGRTSLPASGYGQLAPWLAANGDKVSMGNAGIASLSHLCGVMFKFATQSTFVSIPYKGTAPMLTDLTTGQIDLACDELSTVGSLITTAKVKPYGVTTLGPTTLPPYAALPTLNQTGLTGFNVANWYGLYAPRGTPASVIERLVVGLRAAQADAEFRRRQLAASLVIVDDARAGSTGHRDFLNAEIIRWGPPILASGQFSD